MDIVLIAGMWLDASAWDDVVPELEALGHRPVPVALPGQGDGRTDATYDDQVAAVLTAVDAADRPLVVGHSAACTLAGVAADRRPDAITVVGRAYNRMRTQLATIVLTDPLSGCLNRRGFEQQFRRELARAARAGTSPRLPNVTGRWRAVSRQTV